MIEYSVVIPVYNNSATVRELFERLVLTFTSLGKSFEVLLINDGSRDTSLEVLRTIATEDVRCKVLSLSRNFGQHPAICAGFENAKGSRIVLMDADLQDSPEDIPYLIRQMDESEVDVVYCIKKRGEKKFSSRITSVLYHYTFSKIVRTSVPTNVGTFRMFNRKFLDALLRFKEVEVLYGPLMFFMGFRSSFVTLDFRDRSNGKSSYTFTKRLKLAVNSLISYTDIPHKVSIYFGSLLLFIVIVWGTTIFIQFAMLGRALPTGLTLLVLVSLISLGSILVFLGIIGTYLFRIYQEVLNRPRYLVAESFNFEGEN
ncbi:MAG: glycosyltransferase family 2 protein [Bdellovibrionaceae bacterium]|nr:glycosyltransferase family 2 protein [Pseudobdellovibrionaceae bacterium]